MLARYGQQEFEADLKEDLIKDWLGKALDEYALRPASTPQVEVLDFESGEKLEFQASFEETVNEELRRFGGKEELRGEVENAVRHRIRRELVARMVCEQKGLLPAEEEITARAEEDKQDPEAVRARLLITRAADWVPESQRRNS